jgi:hypothetical protein
MVTFAARISNFPIVEFSVISPESIGRIKFVLINGGIAAEHRDKFAVKAFLLHAAPSAFSKVSIVEDAFRPML